MLDKLRRCWLDLKIWVCCQTRIVKDNRKFGSMSKEYGTSKIVKSYEEYKNLLGDDFNKEALNGMTPGAGFRRRNLQV